MPNRKNEILKINHGEVTLKIIPVFFYTIINFFYKKFVQLIFKTPSLDTRF